MNNFFGVTGNTQVITHDWGLKPIKELIDKNPLVMGLTPGWKTGEVIYQGKCELVEVQLKFPTSVKVIYTTSSQEWFVSLENTRVKTTELNIGDKLISSPRMLVNPVVEKIVYTHIVDDIYTIKESIDKAFIIERQILLGSC